MGAVLDALEHRPEIEHLLLYLCAWCTFFKGVYLLMAKDTLGAALYWMLSFWLWEYGKTWQDHVYVELCHYTQLAASVLIGVSICARRL